MLWNEYCMIRVAVIYRGRAVPIAWRVIEHRSSSITFKEYQALLKRVARSQARRGKGVSAGRPGVCGHEADEVCPPGVKLALSYPGQE